MVMPVAPDPLTQLASLLLANGGSWLETARCPHSSLREDDLQGQVCVVRKGISKFQNSPLPRKNQTWLNQIIKFYCKALAGEYRGNHIRVIPIGKGERHFKTFHCVSQGRGERRKGEEMEIERGGGERGRMSSEE